MNSGSRSLCSLVWNRKAPSQLQVFAWVAVKGKILVKCNLKSGAIFPTTSPLSFTLCVYKNPLIIFSIVMSLNVDLIFRPNGLQMSDEWEARQSDKRVGGGPFTRKRRVACFLFPVAFLWST